MKHSPLEHKLAQALKHASPDNLDKILCRCQPQKGIVIAMTQPQKSSFRPALWIATAACFALLIIGSGFYFRVQNQISSIVSLDVNPSVQLEVNKDSRVIQATATNPEGQAILAEMNLKNTDLNVAVNAIVGALLRHGYVDELENSILVTVEDDDAARAKQLQSLVADQVSSALNSAQVNGAVISQAINPSNNPLQQKADQYGISLGKASLIESLVTNSDHLKFEDLVGLTVNELNLLASEQEQTALNPQNNLTSNGSASSNGYIGIEAAQSVAFKHAGVDPATAVITNTDFDYEMGKMVYEIDFFVNTIEYEYDIDAKDGSVVKFSKEDNTPILPATPAPETPVVPNPAPTTPPVSQPSNGNVISTEQAKAIALQHAGLSEQSIWDFSIELDNKNGRTVYDIDFDASNAEYDYWIDAYSGEVLRSHNEPQFQQSAPQPTQTPQQPSGATISSEQAKTIALQHAGLSASSVYDFSIELDREHGTLVYNVEFEYNGMDYEYEIDANTGAILKIDN